MPPSVRPAAPLAALVLLALAALGTPPAAAQRTAPRGALLAADPYGAPAAYRVLVFTRTAGYRHASIADGVAALRQLGGERGFAVDHTEDAAAFTDAGLAEYAAVVFLSTTGDVLGASGEAALERFVRAGGGFVGVHAAADTEYGWDWYGGLVGARFASHPPGTALADVRVLDPAHPATDALPRRWTRRDEWYNFTASPRGDVHVLAVLGEDTYSGGTHGADHPIAWCHAYDGGRAFYTAGGHTSESFSEPLFLDHLAGGLAWAAGVQDGDCAATLRTRFERTTLAEGIVQPMEVDVAPDGRVFWIERTGALRVWSPATETTTEAGRLDVFSELEDGLLGLALAPDVAATGHVYLYYSPASGAPRNRLSRFTLAGDRLDLASERVLLEVPTQRVECCHAGGALAFGPEGLLYLTTGDNTNPFASDGFAPIDERPGRAAWDAQRTSGSPGDLRGKILRIRPEPDGSYTIPDGNLFADPRDGRPEIYVMGTRNPFRLSVDPETGWLYWGEVGPDAQSARASRGPAGHDEINRAKTAGHFGWPYAVADNRAYRDYDFATGASGPAFDLAATANDSPNRSGARILPPAQPAWIWYPYAASETFPELGTGSRTAMAGPVYHADTTAARGLPAYYDDKLFIYDWERGWIKTVALDEAGERLHIEPFLGGERFIRPIDLEAGPDGALYLLEWGSAFWGGNPDARLTRIGASDGNGAPTARVVARPAAGTLPLTVLFSGADSSDPDAGERLVYDWDFDGDGATDRSGVRVVWTYTQAGVHDAVLTVTDGAGNAGRATFRVVAGNAPPEVRFAAPPAGGFFAWGDSLRFEVAVADAEDGAGVRCEDVAVASALGHNDHAHPFGAAQTCTGVVATSGEVHEDAADVFLLLSAAYTDGGADGVPPLEGTAEIRLHPARLEAEHADRAAGTDTEATTDPTGGGRNVGWIDHGDYLVFDDVNLSGVEALRFRVASAGGGGRIEVRADTTDGPLVAAAHVEPTGGWQTWTDVTAIVDDPGGTRPLVLRFLDAPGAEGLFNLNYLEALGPGVALRADSARGLTAYYFPSADLTGTPVVRRDPVVNFGWGPGAPLDGLPPDGFSVLWEGTLVAPADGAYSFHVRADDGVRLAVNGRTLVDAWQDGAARDHASAPVTLRAGDLVPLRLAYYDRTGDARVHLAWSRDGASPTVVPRAVLDPKLVVVEDRETAGTPSALALHTPFPNPADRATTLRFDLPAPAPVRVALYDLLGRRVAVATDRAWAAGYHRLVVDVSRLAPGLYHARLTTPSGRRTLPLVVAR